MPILSPGQIINETYEIERKIGEGAFSEVYRVKHRFLGRQAMKIFKAPGMSYQEIEKVLGEAVLLSKIEHPNIIRVFDASIFETPDGNFGFFTMEHVPGGSLDQFWRSTKSLIPIETAIDIIIQICKGVAVGHSENPPIVHRDIKPQNILVGYVGDQVCIKVSDFGLAKQVNPLTFYASAKGTMMFKAPEVFQNPLQDSCAGDVWAIGCILYLLLTNHLPYPDYSSQRSKSFTKSMDPPSLWNIDCDENLDSICMKYLSINPIERFRNANECLYSLATWKHRKDGTDFST